MKTKKSVHRLPSNSLYNRCMMSLARISTNTTREFDASERVDELVLEVSKKYVPDNKAYDLDEIISRCSVNMVYGFTDEIPF